MRRRSVATFAAVSATVLAVGAVFVAPSFAPIREVQIALEDEPAIELGPIILIDDEGVTGWMPDGSPLPEDHSIWQSVQVGRSDESGFWRTMLVADSLALITWRIDPKSESKHMQLTMPDLEHGTISFVHDDPLVAGWHAAVIMDSLPPASIARLEIEGWAKHRKVKSVSGSRLKDVDFKAENLDRRRGLRGELEHQFSPKAEAGDAGWFPTMSWTTKAKGSLRTWSAAVEPTDQTVQFPSLVLIDQDDVIEFELEYGFAKPARRTIGAIHLSPPKGALRWKAPASPSE